MNSDYKQQLKDPRWFKVKKRVFRRDNYTCRVCGEKYFLNVHHLFYAKGRKAWDYPIDALITLCNECHNKWHETEGIKTLKPIGIRQIGVISY